MLKHIVSTLSAVLLFSSTPVSIASDVVTSPLIVQSTLQIGTAITAEAALSFLGVGVQPPTPSWGEMLRTGKSYLYEAPYYAVLPGIVLTLTILSLDTLGRTLALVLEDRHEVAEEEAEPDRSAA